MPVDWEAIHRSFWYFNALSWLLTNLACLVWAASIMISWVAMFALLHPVMGVAAIVVPLAHIVLIFLGPEYQGWNGRKVRDAV